MINEKNISKPKNYVGTYDIIPTADVLPVKLYLKIFI